MAVVARQLGARSRRGWIYRGVTCTVRPGEVAAIAGPAGSGRTSLLLAMAARMSFSTGSLTVFGEELPHGTGAVRARVAVARAGGAAELEPELRVRDHLLERGNRDRGARFDLACERLDLEVARESFVGELGPGRATLLSMALALVDQPRVVVLDDLDRGLPTEDQTVLWQRMRSLAEGGTTVVATTTDPAPAGGNADVVVNLGGTP